MEGAQQPSTPLWLTIAVGVIIPLLTAYIGWQAGNSSINKDYVQIAAQIAQNEKSPKPLRAWAAKLLNEMSPVPFSENVEKTLAIYPARNLAYETFILLPKDFLKYSFATPCKNYDTAFPKKSLTIEQATVIVNSYQECRLKMDAMIDVISQMKKSTDEMAAEQINREKSEIKKAGDPFADKNE